MASYNIVHRPSEVSHDGTSVLVRDNGTRFVSHNDMRKWWIMKAGGRNKWQVHRPAVEFVPKMANEDAPEFDTWEQAALFAWQHDNRCGPAPSLIEFLAFNLSPAMAHHATG